MAELPKSVGRRIKIIRPIKDTTSGTTWPAHWKEKQEREKEEKLHSDRMYEESLERAKQYHLRRHRKYNKK